MRKSYLFYLCFLFILNACSDGLSRDKAADIIREHYQLPTAYYDTFFLEDQTHVNFGEYRFRRDSIKQRFEKLQSLGLVTWYSDYNVGRSLVRAKLTAEGMKYAKGEPVKVYNPKSFHKEQTIQAYLYDISLKEVTGMQLNEDNSKATVEYVLNRNNITPFGEVLYIQPGEEKHTANFAKYDDGWRIVEE